MKRILFVRFVALTCLVSAGVLGVATTANAASSRKMSPALTGHEEVYPNVGCTSDGYIRQYQGVALNFAAGKKVEVYFNLYNFHDGKEQDGVSETYLYASSSGSLTTPWHYFTLEPPYGTLIAHWTAVQFVAYYPYPIDDGPYYSLWKYCSGAPAAPAK